MGNCPISCPRYLEVLRKGKEIKMLFFLKSMKEGFGLGKLIMFPPSVENLF
jgi:hypothetical protein